jgi:hypothetical protein
MQIGCSRHAILSVSQPPARVRGAFVSPCGDPADFKDTRSPPLPFIRSLGIGVTDAESRSQTRHLVTDIVGDVHDLGIMESPVLLLSARS